MEDCTAISWPIVGQFKSHDGIAGCYMIPIAGVTNSGIKFFTWTQRFLLALGREGLHKGWAFQRSNGSHNKAKEYKEDIFLKLEIIQASTTFIDPECNIWDDYGVQRSGRRFFTTHCTNMGVLPHLIELQACWKTDRANGERTVQRTMIHLYSKIRNTKDTLVKPSKAC